MHIATNFGPIDWAIVAAYLIGSLAVGIYAHRYVGRLQDYLVAGRTLRVKLGVATMIATELGLVTLMYMGQQGFLGGPAAMHMAVASFLGVLAIGLSGFIVYRLRASGVMTVPEFYQQRYNARVRWLGGVILAISGIVNMGVFLQVDAKFLIAVTGIEQIQPSGWEAGAALKWVMIGMITVVLVYTALGGMVSVVVTDLFQFIVLSLGMLIVTAAAITRLGWSEVFDTVQQQLGREAFDPLASGQYGWAYVVWMVWISLAAGALWHSATLRALSTRSPQVAKQVFALSSVGFLARFAIPAFWGLCAYVFVLNGPESVRGMFLDAAGSVRTTASGEKVDTLYAMPLFIGQTVPSVLLGIVCAGMLAASMSTYSSYLLCWSSVITQDIVGPLWPTLGQRGRIVLTRLGVVLIGAYLVAFGLFFYTPDIWKFLAATGTVYLSGASAIVVLGLYWKRASSTGALAALLLGVLGMAGAFKGLVARTGWIADDGSWPARLLSSESNVALATVAASWTAMIVLSLVFPDRPRGSSAPADSQEASR